MWGSSVPACQSSPELQELRRRVAQLWCGDAAGDNVWTVVAVSEHGFTFKGAYFEASRFQPWDQGRLWDRYVWRAALLIRRGEAQALEAASAMLFSLREAGKAIESFGAGSPWGPDRALEVLIRAAIEKAEKAGIR